ncbi:hypothetical protein JYU20_02840 [Bacteroidales bacterium AH-315-I05]|nr:hypothetical protein [Bacteroidales bacterium AH-315-I05]
MKTLKNTLGAILIVAFVMPVFESCKKGEEDSFLSLKSRDSRITGTWTLKNMEYDYTYTTTSPWGSSSQGTTKEYDGEEMTITTVSNYVGSASTTISVSEYETYTISIWKDGTYEMNTTEIPKFYSYDGTVTTITGEEETSKTTGRWWWVDSKKNKTHLAMDDDYYAPYLLKLSNKEMIWQWVWDDESEEKDQSGTTTTTMAGTSKWTWEKTDKKQKK